MTKENIIITYNSEKPYRHIVFHEGIKHSVCNNCDLTRTECNGADCSGGYFKKMPAKQIPSVNMVPTDTNYRYLAMNKDGSWLIHIEKPSIECNIWSSRERIYSPLKPSNFTGSWRDSLHYINDDGTIEKVSNPIPPEDTLVWVSNDTEEWFLRFSIGKLDDKGQLLCLIDGGFPPLVGHISWTYWKLYIEGEKP